MSRPKHVRPVVAYTAVVVAGLLAWMLGLLAAPLPRAAAHPFGQPGDERIVSRFLMREANQTDTFRWTSASSAMRFYGYERATTLLVSLRLQGPPHHAALPVTLQSGAAGPTAQLIATPHWRVYHVLMPQRERDWTPTLLNLSSATFQPGGDDDRQLGVVISMAMVAALPNLALPAVLARASFFTGLCLLIWVLLTRWTSRWLAAGGVVITSSLLLISSLTVPARTSFWLPQVWTIVSLGLALLVLPPLMERLRPWVTKHKRMGVPLVGLALAGAGLLWFHCLLVVGGVLLLGGALAGALAVPHHSVPVPRPLIVLGLLVALGVATAARFYQLGSVPLGLWRDEARYGLLALRILRDPLFRPVYVPGGVDYPGLLFYLTALVTQVVDVQPATVRIVAAAAGALTPVALFALGQRLVGARAALIAALLAAGAAWHVSISRISFVAVLDPLLTMTGLALLWAGLTAEQRQTRWLWFILSGLSLGLALYTYHTARLAPLLALLTTLTVLGWSRQRWVRAAGGLLVTALVAFAVVLPLLGYAMTHPADINLRMRQTSVLTQAESQAVSAPAALNTNLRRYLRMWHVAGDGNGRHYLPGYPMVDPVVGAALLVGALQLLAPGRTRKDWLLLGWIGLACVPPLLSEGAPHAVRSVGLIAPTLLLAGRGLDSVWQAVEPRLGRTMIPGLVALSLAINIGLYFGTMPYLPAVWDKFYVPETMMAMYARSSAAADQPVYLPRQALQTDVGRYLTDGVQVQSWAEGDPPAPLPAGSRVLVPANATDSERRWVEQWTGAVGQPMQLYPGTSNPIFWLYQRP